MNFVAALLYAVVSSVLAGTVAGFARGGLDRAGAVMALAIGAFVGLLGWWRGRGAAPASKKPAAWEWAVIGVFALVCARAFLWLVFTSGDELKVLSPNNLGDLSLHLTYIEYLAQGAPFWPENPIFTGRPLTYPVGVDLFNSLLVLSGLDAIRGLIWVAIGGAISTGVALWRWGRGVALLAFLANGGLAGLEIFRTGQLADFQSELAWKSIFLSIFVTQRGLLVALPAGLLLLASWRTRFFAAERDGRRLPAWGEVLFYAAMPVFHVHTFIFLSLMLAGWFVMQPLARGALLRLVGFSVVPATALVALVTGWGKGASVLGWKAGWMWDDPVWIRWCEAHLQEPSAVAIGLLFWPMNFGFLLLFAGWLVHALVKDRTAKWPRALCFPALLIFLLCCFVKFASWEWDNTKIMLWSYLAMVPAGWKFLLAPRPFGQQIAAGVLLFFSGFLSLLGGLDSTHTGHDIMEMSTLRGVRKAVTLLPISARFIGYPTYNHPLLLAGRKMALGYPGHAWSHGLDYLPRQAEVDMVMKGGPQWRSAADRLGVRYLFWGAEEIEHYPKSEQPWTDSTRLVASGSWGAIFDLQTPATAAENESALPLP